MLIQELTRQESVDLLARARLGRLACANDTQPYVVPFFFAFDNDYLFGFSTVGQKIEWMRANPNVCVEVDEIVNPQQWMSVVVFGQYEEMPNLPEWQSAREIREQKAPAAQLHLVGACLRENDSGKYRTTAGAFLLPYSHRADHRPSRYP